MGSKNKEDIKIPKEIESIIGEYPHLKRQRRVETKELKKLKSRLKVVLEGQKAIQSIAKLVQERAHHQIASVVTRCLKAILDKPYEFKILFELKRGKTEARLVFKKNELILDPQDSCGGGVLDVAAFALRLACLILRQPSPRRVMVLDEPFKMLSKNYATRVVDLLMILSLELKIQFIIVTHNPELKIGKVIEL